MRMAKASQSDLDMAMELTAMLDTLEQGHMPTKIARNDFYEHFDSDDDEQCGRALRALLETADRGSLFRVVYGAVVMLDPDNKLVDPNADTIEHHPDRKAAQTEQPVATPIAWCNSAELQDALAKKQSFNGWTQRHDNTNVALFLIPPPPIPQSHVNNMTSDNPPLQPLSVEELREQWNAQADYFNEWESLDLDEQLAWAQARAIQRDRALRGRLESQGVASIKGGLA